MGQPDHYSESQVAKLLSAHPEWSNYCSFEHDKNSGFDYFLLSLPSPAIPSRTLHLYSANQEITLAFCMYECHFNDLTNPYGGELEVALEWVAQILNDELLSLSFWNGQNWAGSKLIERGEKAEKPDWCTNSSRAEIRSWSGKFDQDVAAL